MPPHRPLLTRGRSLVFLFAGTLLAAFLAGWLRAQILSNIGEGLLLSLPWLWAKRLALGVLVDIPLGLSTVIVGAIGGRLLIIKPWRSALSLTASVWTLDLCMAWLVTHDFLLWTDTLVLLTRMLVSTATAFCVAMVLGWRPRFGKSDEKSETGDEKDERSSA